MAASDGATPDSYSIRLDAGESSTHLVLAGTLGVAEATDVHRATRALLAGEGRVGIAWSAVESIDTAIAQLLIALAAALRNDGRLLELPPPPPRVEAFLHRTALHQVLFP